MVSFETVLDSYIKIIPEEASKIQVLETKRAFISGAFAFMSLMHKAADIPSIEIAETRVLSLHLELDKLKRELIK